MRHDMKQPCTECPYVGKWAGWIGDHESAQDFVDIARADAEFPCHMSLDQDGDTEEQLAEDEGQQCAGQALFMNRMCKMSRRREMAEMQSRLKKECKVEVLFP